MTETAATAGSLPVPEPELTPEQMIERAEVLIPMLREQQDDAEQRGYHSEEVLAEFVRAGFSRICQPRRFGGYEFDLTTFAKTMVAIATGDPGTGWCVTLGSSHAVVVASFFPEDVQAEAFGPDGEFRCPHAVTPVGEAVRADGGWRVSGRGIYASGIPYATWVLTSALVQPPGGDGPPTIMTVLIPRRDLTMLDDWGLGKGQTMGMLSSGSNSFVIDDAFVPDRFTLPLNWFEDRPVMTVGYELHRNPLYVFRPGGPYHASLVIPVIGAARAAMDEFESIIRVKQTTFPPIMPRYRFHDDQRAYGMAMAMTDAAEAILYSFTEQYMDACRRAVEGEPTLDSMQDARWWAMLQQAGGLAATAVEGLAQRSTSSATGSGSRLGRYLRDVTTYRQHISSQQIDHAVRNAAFYLGASDAWMPHDDVRQPPAR
jgi:3-hydroxy-9,10-secoandrosta-1,3,5(10)-triene-9,17-dione monooxygenase